MSRPNQAQLNSLVIDLVELCEALPETAVRTRLDAAADDLIRMALGATPTGGELDPLAAWPA